jgi:hypothetical protein
VITKVIYAAVAAALLAPVPAFAADLERPEYSPPPAADLGPPEYAPPAYSEYAPPVVRDGTASRHPSAASRCRTAGGC